MEHSQLLPEDIVSIAGPAPMGHKSLYRSIPTAHPTKFIFYPDRLTEEEAEFAALLADETSGISHEQRPEDRWYQYGDNEKTEFCFEAVNIPTSRFSDGSFPVWYGATSQEASQAEVIHHLRKQAACELAHCESENAVRFERAWCRAVVSLPKACNISSVAREGHPGLRENGPPWPFCNQVGITAHREKFHGLVTASRRWPVDDCWAVFDSGVISGSVVRGYWDVVIGRDETITLCSSENVTYENGEMVFL